METTNQMMSESINELATALSAFQSEVEQPELNKTNPYFKSKYVDLSGVLKAVLPVLSKNGLAVVQIMDGDNLVTLLTHKSGQWIKGSCPIGTYKNQQDRGSAITYTKRYGLCALLGIAADTDDDGNSATDSDKKNGFGKGRQTEQDQVTQAMSDIQNARSRDELQSAWKKWSPVLPQLFQPNGMLYKEFALKGQELNHKTA